ncbi:hemin uptake protein HemP [Martelella mediterranea]|uniref:Hemin uptake protein n=1 Tax=Martelella mediterranea DSM 17316 TaxID=1122214 RepID=A0A1U9Z600_9HYPH|nr:hemin uptake protein HemP [Martelella mediterranea]AQZ53159.1 Hemin uptake protein [Martelella mediterranea DSM 17316]
MNHDKEPAKTGTKAGARGLPVLESETLFQGRNEIVIRHQGAEYRMKITRQGKLILNK